LRSCCAGGSTPKVYPGFFGVALCPGVLVVLAFLLPPRHGDTKKPESFAGFVKKTIINLWGFAELLCRMLNPEGLSGFPLVLLCAPVS